MPSSSQTLHTFYRLKCLPFISSQTCPVVNCIYPAHLRIPANDSDYNAETDEELGLKEYKDDEETKSMQDDDEVAVVVQTTKLGVIVDRMEHLQGLMSLLSCFIPNNSNSKLSVTGVSPSLLIDCVQCRPLFS